MPVQNYVDEPLMVDGNTVTSTTRRLVFTTAILVLGYGGRSSSAR